MKTKALENLLTRIESWPADAQDRLAEIARDIEADFGGIYYPPPEERRMLDEARAAVKRGEIATDDEVEAVFAKYLRS